MSFSHWCLGIITTINRERTTTRITHHLTIFLSRLIIMPWVSYFYMRSNCKPFFFFVFQVMDASISVDTYAPLKKVMFSDTPIRAKRRGSPVPFLEWPHDLTVHFLLMFYFQGKCISVIYILVAVLKRIKSAASWIWSPLTPSRSGVKASWAIKIKWKRMETT